MIGPDRLPNRPRDHGQLTRRVVFRRHRQGCGRIGSGAEPRYSLDARSDPYTTVESTGRRMITRVVDRIVYCGFQSLSGTMSVDHCMLRTAPRNIFCIFSSEDNTARIKTFDDDQSATRRPCDERRRRGRCSQSATGRTVGLIGWMTASCASLSSVGFSPSNAPASVGASRSVSTSYPSPLVVSTTSP